MRSSVVYASLGLCASAAHILPPTGSQQWNFTLEAKGKASGTVGQLPDGQIRIGGNYSVAEFKFVKVGDEKTGGVVFDSKYRGCIVTPPNTTQWQCDQGKAPSPGWDFDCSNKLLYHRSSAFWACPVNDNGEWNIYVTPTFGQKKCTPITLSIRGGAWRPTGCAKHSVAPTGTAPVHPVKPTKTPPKSIYGEPSHPAAPTGGSPVHPVKPTTTPPKSLYGEPSHPSFPVKPKPSPSSLAPAKPSPSPSGYAAKSKPVPSSYSGPSASPTRPSYSPSQSDLPVPKIQSKLIMSPDGTCGSRTNYTCAGFKLGSCCSHFGWCGATTPFCGMGCQHGYGKCDVFNSEYQPSGTSSSVPSSSTSSVTPVRPSATPYTTHEDDDEDIQCHCHDDCVDDETNDENVYGYKIPTYVVPPKKPEVEAQEGHKHESSTDSKHGNYTAPPASNTGGS